MNRACEEFSISVAFITMGGITPLLQTLEELERRNIPGRIMTTDYLTFSEPRALEKLSALTKNKEWNTRLVSMEHGEYAQQIMDEYNLLWNSKYCECFEDFIDKYQVKYEVVKKQKKIARQTQVPDLDQ